jgi:uncharacterized protein YbaR (Trm112 family)
MSARIDPELLEILVYPVEDGIPVMLVEEARPI